MCQRNYLKIPYQFYKFIVRVEQIIHHLLVFGHVWVLGQIGDFYVISPRYFARIRGVFSGNNFDKATFSGTITGDKGYFLAGLNTKRKVLEKQFFAKRFCKVFNCEIIHLVKSIFIFVLQRKTIIPQHCYVVAQAGHLKIFKNY